MRTRNEGRGGWRGAVQPRRSARGLLAALVAGLLLPAAGEAQSQPAGDPSAPPVGLDALLKLPDRTPTPSARSAAGGATKDEWQLRFAQARLAREEAGLRLAEAQAELEKLAAGTSTWQVAAPGGSTAASESGPLSYSLREEIRRSRREIAQADRSLDELRVEANLAGVPQEWIAEPETQSAGTAADPNAGFQEPTP